MLARGCCRSGGGWVSLPVGACPHSLVRLFFASTAFLVSLYVKDVWLGTRQPDTLLAHVRMVCDAAEDTVGGEEEAIVVLCKDTAASTLET